MILIFCFMFLLTAGLALFDPVNEEGVGGLRVSAPSGYSDVRLICKDRDGMIWLTRFQGGLYCYDGANAVNFYPDTLNAASISSRNINCLFVDSRNRIWVGTQKGLDQVTDDRMQVRHHLLPGVNNYITGIGETPSGTIYAWTTSNLLLFDESAGTFEEKVAFGANRSLGRTCCLMDREGKTWSSTGRGIECFDAACRRIKDIPVSRPVSHLVYDGLHTVFVLSDGHLDQYDIRTVEKVPLAEGLRPLEKERIKNLCQAGQYLLFTTGQAIYSFDPSQNAFYDFRSPEFPFDLPADLSVVSELIPDAGGNLWIRLREGGFREAEKTMSGSPYSGLSRQIGGRRILSLAYDQRFFWLLLKGERLITYDLDRRAVVSEVSASGLLGLPPEDMTREPANYNQWTLARAPDGDVLLSNWQGGVLLRPGRDGALVSSRRIILEEVRYPFPTLTFGTDGSLWGAGRGCDYWYAPAPEPGNDAIVLRKAGAVSAPSNINTDQLLALRDGRVVLGFSDIGPVILDPSGALPKTVDFPMHFDQLHISDLQEDERGGLWIASTDWGLFRYDLAEGRTIAFSEFKNARVRDIFCIGDEIYVHSEASLYRYNRAGNTFSLVWSDLSDKPDLAGFFRFPDGRMVVDDHGVLRYVPLRGQDESQRMASPVHVILASSDRVITMLQTSRMKGHSATVRLGSFPSNLTIGLSLMDGTEEVVSYAYRINKRRGEWHQTLASSMPLYNLHYGRNRISFKVQSLMSASESPEYDLYLQVTRPWYHWAIILAVLLGLGALVFFWNQRNEKRREAEAAHAEKRRQEEINLHNIDFFANISHEFRTPLTLIDGALDSLSPEEPAAEQSRMKMVIRRNTDRMLKLVGQLLDFNKLDHDMLRLSVSLTDASAVISRVTEQFRFGAAQKDVDLVLEGCEVPQLMWLDADKLEKVQYNLLSNALKFTPPGGAITVSVASVDSGTAAEGFGLSPELGETRFLKVSVADTGIGIPEDKRRIIFDRFAQVESTRKAGGTGIGLYFTKSLVELHHGAILADNRRDLPEGRTGAVFSYILPMGELSYSREERTAASDTDVTLDGSAHPSEYLVREETEDNGKPAVVVIDDDYEMVYFLKSILSPCYRVLCRFDAASGYQLIEKEQPDLVLSDVMMVEMDGLQLCRMIKENIAICHIPVILLTAKSRMEDQIQGLGAGADAYLVKPFNKDYLLAMIRTQLENRQRVRRLLGSATEPGKVEGEGLSPIDKSLLDKMFSLMESSLEDGELNIDDIAAQLGISRTKFYGKVKALTGQTPNEFFNVYKLNRAAELIKEGKLKISAIASMVGFNSASHFAILFKKRFGVTPSQYLENEAGRAE